MSNSLEFVYENAFERDQLSPAAEQAYVARVMAQMDADEADIIPDEDQEYFVTGPFV
jgi:hypothetical protein